MGRPKNGITWLLAHPRGAQALAWKIDAILHMVRPRNIKQMQSFLGAVNYYRDMWPKWAHILTPLSDESGKKPFHWTDEMDKAFKQMKAILSLEVLMA